MGAHIDSYDLVVRVNQAYDMPEEDWEEGKVGKLLKSMYGARDAAQKWEEEYAEFMMEI